MQFIIHIDKELFSQQPKCIFQYSHVTNDVRWINHPMFEMRDIFWLHYPYMM